jgi:hypothetical protein
MLTNSGDLVRHPGMAFSLYQQHNRYGTHMPHEQCGSATRVLMGCDPVQVSCGPLHGNGASAVHDASCSAMT